MQGVAGCAAGIGCANPRLSRRCWLSVHAAIADAVTCGFAFHSTSVLAVAANLLRRSLFADSFGDLPLRWGEYLTEFDHY